MKKITSRKINIPPTKVLINVKNSFPKKRFLRPILASVPKKSIEDEKKLSELKKELELVNKILSEKVSKSERLTSELNAIETKIIESNNALFITELNLQRILADIGRKETWATELVEHITSLLDTRVIHEKNIILLHEVQDKKLNEFHIFVDDLNKRKEALEKREIVLSEKIKEKDADLIKKAGKIQIADEEILQNIEEFTKMKELMALANDRIKLADEKEKKVSFYEKRIAKYYKEVGKKLPDLDDPNT
jgi:hypothetical protein